MEFGKFQERKERLKNQYENISWDTSSGLSKDELLPHAEKIFDELSESSIQKARAQVLKYILENGRICVEKEDFFHEKLDCYKIFSHLTWKRLEKTVKDKFASENEEKELGQKYGAYAANHDFGHTSPNTKRLLELGFGGLLERIRSERNKKATLSKKQIDFYDACETTLGAITAFIKRYSTAVEKADPDAARCLLNISETPPGDTYEALCLLVIYFSVHELIFGARVRTLGRMDVLLYDLYKKDLDSRKFTKEQIRELYCYFLTKLWSMKVPFDLPMMIGGLDSDGNEVTNELSYLIVEAYDSLDIHSPKIHIRVSEKTPESFVKLVLSCIRGGNSSFVFVNDKTAVKSLKRVGISEKDALDYVLIGCYEPAVWGIEMPCTGNGTVNLAKAVELAMNGGCDMASGEKLGVDVPEILSFEDFKNAVKAQISYICDKVISYINGIEQFYPIIYADPILSSMYDKSVSDGIDLYEKGAAKYNNSAFQIMGIATLTDSLCAVKKLVFDEKRISFDEFCKIIKNNWQGSEKLRLICSNLKEKYGNGNSLADGIAKEMAAFASSCVLCRENGRGGIFKPGLFSIDHCYTEGAKTSATPDGRFAGEPFSKNLCAVVGKDKNGITSLINSVTEIDLSAFPNGSVLDIVLHPSAVSGEDGLCGMYSILKSYFEKGGFAMHGNVFDANVLKDAQKMPEKYSTLQVRLCGWNVYFVNLSKAEQDDFIKQAENI